LFEHDLFGKPDHALAHCLSMISAQNASPLLGSREGRCSSIGLGACFSGSRSRGMNSRFLRLDAPYSEGWGDQMSTPAFLPARLHQNEQPKLCSEALIASVVCLHVPSMVDFADGFLAISSHIFRVWSSCAL
jgi:hypothetical protein